MRDQILELIDKHPKHYSLLIKKNKQLFDWIKENTLIECDHFPTMIYSAINNVNPNESESINMFRAGYLRYWNTGNIVLRYRG